MNCLNSEPPAVPGSSAPDGKGRVPFFSLVRLSISDLAHEYVLTLCNALACAAVLAPLLLLFGLRYGAIETLRHRLLEDPRNREIRPNFGQIFPRDWFLEVARRNDIAFVIPHIRQIAAGVDARRQDSEDPYVALDVAPTASGDPLLSEYGVYAPAERECVLTAPSAAALSVNTGDYIQTKVGRTRGSAWETQTVIIRVAGVLPDRAGSLRLMYLGLPLVEAIERFKDGMAVPGLGWEGATGEATPAYDGIIICGDNHHLGQQDKASLTNGTGLTDVSPLKAEDAGPVLGYSLPEKSCCFLLTASGALVEGASLQTVKSRIKEGNWIISPFVRPRKATLASGDSEQKTPVMLVSAPADIMEKIGIVRAEAGIEPIAYIAAESAAVTSPILHVTEGARHISLPLTLRSAPLPAGMLLVGIDVGGQLNLLRDRPLEFEQESGLIRHLRRSYTSFRLYSRTLEDVVALERLFRESGIEVITQANRIQDVLRLDQNLGILFWLIACVAITGGLFTLATSLYASIERKRRDMGVLRLLGVPLQSLIIFPVAQGMAIVAIGLTISLGLYFIGSSVAENLFAEHFQSDDQLCMVKISHVAAAAGISQILAIAAGCLASARLSLSDPASVLRREL